MSVQVRASPCKSVLSALSVLAVLAVLAVHAVLMRRLPMCAPPRSQTGPSSRRLFKIDLLLPLVLRTVGVGIVGGALVRGVIRRPLLPVGVTWAEV